MENNYQKFGSVPPINNNQQAPYLPQNIQPNSSYPPNQYQPYPPQNLPNQPNYPSQPYVPQPYAPPVHQPYPPLVQPYQPIQYPLIRQPILGPNSYHSAFVCVLTALLLTFFYQIWILILFVLEGAENVMGGLFCGIWDLFSLISCLILFRASKEIKKYCKFGVIVFVASVGFFILTSILMFWENINGYTIGIYYYANIYVYFVLQVIFRVSDIVAILFYCIKRFKAA